MSINKMGSKLAQGVRQVKSQQERSGQSETDKSEGRPVSVRDDIDSTKTYTATQSSAPQGSNQAASAKDSPISQSGSALHPRRVWPD